MEDLKSDMVQESLARRFRPADFEQPEGSRKYHTEAPEKLQEAFYSWVSGLPERSLTWEESENQYQKAVKSLEEFGEFSYKEANSLLVDFKPRTRGQKKSGLFLSACYTHSPEGAIIFDVDAPKIACIGYKTKKDIFNNRKAGDWFAYNSSGLAINNGDCRNWFARFSSGLAINNGDCGNDFANSSSGLAVNNGECRDWFAQYSSGLAVNNGDCRDHFAWSSSGFAVAVKEPKSYGYREKSRRTIRPADCERIPQLKGYLEELSEITRSIKNEQSAKRFLERYGPEPRERIKQEIKEMIRKGGFKI